MRISKQQFLIYSAIAIPFSLFQSQISLAQIYEAIDSTKPQHTFLNRDDFFGAETYRENWDSISLRDSKLEAQEPLEGLKEDTDGFTRELISVQWRPSDPIHLFVIRPSKVQKPPVILYLYSYPSETDRYLNDDFCRLLVKNGFAAVGFSSALTGQRYHDRPMQKWFVSELQESLGTSVHDVQMIINYLDKRSDFNMSQIGMFGDGSGATIAILSAAADSRIKAVDLLNPWGDWPTWLAQSTLIPENERPDYLTPEFLQTVDGLDPVKWLPKLKSRSVRLQFVGDVSVTPKASKNRLALAAPANATIVRYKDRTAFTRQAGMGGKVFDWLKQKLGPAVSNQQISAKVCGRSGPSSQTKKTER
jgi:hypothetical protein